MIGMENVWEVGNIKEVIISWHSIKGEKKIKVLSLNIYCGVSLGRKLSLFKVKETLPLKCAIQYFNILNTYPWVEENHSRNEPIEEVINIISPKHTLMVLEKQDRREIK